MDVLTLRPYQRMLHNRTTSFLEFFINDQALSELIDSHYGLSDSFLEDYTGVLGNAGSLPAEIIKIKQLLGKNVSDEEVERLWADALPEGQLDETFLLTYRDELSAPEIIIYQCAECAHYDCGGVTVIIHFDDNVVKWQIVDKPQLPVFTFDKYAYYSLLNAQLKKRLAT